MLIHVLNMSDNIDGFGLALPFVNHYPTDANSEWLVLQFKKVPLNSYKIMLCISR